MNASQNRKAWLAVVSAYQTCADRYDQLLREFGFSTAQFEVLNVIHELGGTAQPKDVAARLLVTKGNITGLIRRLGVAGWVQVLPHPSDGRSLQYRLTPRAERAVASARGAAARFIDEQASPFSARELATIETLMRRMEGHLRGMDVPAIARAATPRAVTRSAAR